MGQALYLKIWASCINSGVGVTELIPFFKCHLSIW